jgi:hypothetical protein
MCDDRNEAAAIPPGEPTEKEGAIAIEIERCQAILDRHNSVIGSGARDLENHVRRSWDRSEGLRELFGGWRWVWTGEVDGGLSEGVVRSLWEQSVREVETYNGGSWFNLASETETRRFLHVGPNTSAFRFSDARAAGPVLWGESSAVGSLSLQPPSLMAELEDYRGRVDSWFEAAEREVKVLDPCATVRLKGTGERPTRVLGRALEKVVKAAGSPVEGAKLQDAGRRFSEKLGQAWLSGRRPWRVLFSVAPSTFLRLGNVGERDSCYQFGGAYQRSKTALPSMPGGVCAFVYPEAEGDQGVTRGAVPPSGKIGGRAVGFMSYNPDVPGATFSNHYLIQRETQREVIGAALVKLFGGPGVLHPDEDLFGDWANPRDGTSLYSNGDGWSWTGPGVVTGPGVKGVLDLRCALRDQRGTCDCYAVAVPGDDTRRECYSCGDRVEDGFWCIDCDQWTCRSCGFRDSESGVSACLHCRTPAECICGREGSEESLTRCVDCDDFLCSNCREWDENEVVCSSCNDCRIEEKETLEGLAAEAAAVGVLVAAIESNIEAEGVAT